MARPKYKLVMKRKDGQSVSYVNYNGEQRTGKVAPVLAIFEDSKRPGGFYVQVESGGPLGELAKDYWFNIYDGDLPSRGYSRGSSRGSSGGGGGEPGPEDDLPF